MRRIRLNSNRAEDRGAQRAALVLLGCATVAFGALLAYIGYEAPNSVPGRGYYTVQAEFQRADNLAAHYQVRVGGRLIGQVLNPRVRGGRALVDLQLKKDVKPLLSDTRLRVRPRSAIGVRFVDVQPGSRGRPLRDGETIPASQTSASLPLDTTLDVLDTKRRARLKTLLDKLGAGTAGRGEELNVAFGKGGELFGGLDDALTPLNRRPGAVEGFVAGIEGLAAAADPIRGDIAAGFRPEADALRPFAEHGDAVRATLDEAPPTLATARDQLPPTSALLARTASFARAAAPTLQRAPRALRETSSLLRTARPPLRAADETLQLAGRAVDPALDLLRTIRPVLPVADDALLDGLPFVGTLARHGCDITMFGRNWADATATGNTGGQFLRLVLVRPGKEQLAGTDTPDRSGIFSSPYPEPCTTTKEPKR
ncbi:MAG TPA: MlaD family protein [Baekduia sp.]|nr:MlaD family protein [Baekduia sp.]